MSNQVDQFFPNIYLLWRSLLEEIDGGVRLIVEFSKKQARKGFRPPSAMLGIGYFQN